jgi:O-antigen ligase
MTRADSHRASAASPAATASASGPGRDGLLLAAILAAVVATPAVPMPFDLPDLRLEQALAVPALLLLLRHRPPPWRLLAGFGPIDAALLALGAVTTLSILHAGLVLGEHLSPRDGYEIVKLVLYWTLFRFALVAGARPIARRTARTALFAAAVVAALVALAQYLDLPGARAAGAWWAPAHHLRALARDGRAFGLAANPNYFGALMALVTLAALAVRVEGTPQGGRWAAMALAAGVLGVVLSGSRGALGLLSAGLVTFWLLTLGRGSIGPRVLRATALLAVAFLAAVLLVETVPRGRQDYLTRVAGALSPTGDSDLALRLERWRGWLGGRGPGAESAPAPALGGTGLPTAPAEARARDAHRKADVRRLVAAVERFRAATGTVPETPATLVPGFLDALPADPADGAPYRYERTASGFTVAARLEDPADPDYPLFATGDVGNYLQNGDAEEGEGGRAAGFRALPGTIWERASRAALFGDFGIAFRGSQSAPQRRAAVYQQRYLNRPGGAPFTATVWVRLMPESRGEVFLYVNVYYADGGRADPYARVAADPTRPGVWQRLSLTITPDAGRRVDFIGVYLLSDDFQGEAHADGFELVDGSVPVSFPGLRAADRAGADLGARFRRSPLLGSGPGKAAGGATVDNEYLLVLGRYGLLGLAAYLALWVVLLRAALRAARTGVPLAAAVAGGVVGLLLFNLVAGSLYQLQLMGLFWPLVGLALSEGRRIAPER